MSTVIEKDTVPQGPYRATKLWNDVLKSFREGMPRGRHWRRWKNYTDCFVASDAVSWLHDWLIKNPNFGQAVTRQQSVQLLQKLHRAGVILDVRGSKHNATQFVDSYRLFIFSQTSPKKSPHKSTSVSTAPRPPLSAVLRQTNSLSGNDTKAAEKPGLLSKKPPKVPGRERSYSARVVSPQESSQSDVENIYKCVTLSKLKQALGVDTLSNILNSETVIGAHIHHNVTQVNRNGIVTNVDKKDQLPHWVVAAMRCLARWPEKTDNDTPDYPGFERDVFKVVEDHFTSQSEPVIPYQLYDCFTNVMGIMAEDGDIEDEDPFVTPRPPAIKPNSNLHYYQSAEKLILDMTANATSSFDTGRSGEVLVVHDPLPHGHTGVKHGFSSLHRQISVPDLPGLRLETRFGLDNNEPETIMISESMASTPSVMQGRSSGNNPMVGHNKFNSTSNVNEVRVPENRLSQEGGQVGSSNCDNRATLFPSASSPGLNNVVNPRTAAKRSSPPPYVSPPSYNSLYGSEVGLSRKLLGPRTLSACPSTVYSTSAVELSGQTKSTSSKEQWAGPVANRCRSFSTGLDQIKRSGSMSGMWRSHLRSASSAISLSGVSVNGEAVDRALQLCCLFLCPAERRKLSLLLRFMNKVATNTELVLDEQTANKDLMVNTFTRCILRCRDEVDYDEVAARNNVEFLMMNYANILAVPSDFRVAVEQEMLDMMRPKVKYCGSWSSDEQQTVFCERVSVTEYEQQKLSASQEALHQLLLNIVNDKEMSQSAKQRRLKQFERSYPDIYAHYCPGDGAGLTSKTKPHIKQPLLSRPLRKLRSLRL